MKPKNKYIPAQIITACIKYDDNKFIRCPKYGQGCVIANSVMGGVMPENCKLKEWSGKVLTNNDILSVFENMKFEKITPESGERVDGLILRTFARAIESAVIARMIA